jgi:hypothetical protein
VAAAAANGMRLLARGGPGARQPCAEGRISTIVAGVDERRLGHIGRGGLERRLLLLGILSLYAT